MDHPTGRKNEDNDTCAKFMQEPSLALLLILMNNLDCLIANSPPRQDQSNMEEMCGSVATLRSSGNPLASGNLWG